MEAVALRQLAAAQILPSLNVGTNFDSHTGPLERSTGVIQKENREALYLGMGANAVGAGTVNIPGLVLSGNVSELIYGRLIARQVVRERQFASAAVCNDVLLRVADGYMELLRAEGRRAVAVKTREEAREVARTISTLAVIGQERSADANRAATELEQRDADVLQAEGEVLTASARLAQLLDLAPSPRLQATDGWVVPAPLIPDPIPLPELIAIALMQRPELAERRAAIQETLLALNAAKVLPFSPNVIVGYSAGTFGGGSNIASDGTVANDPRFGSFAPRRILTPWPIGRRATSASATWRWFAWPRATSAPTTFVRSRFSIGSRGGGYGLRSDARPFRPDRNRRASRSDWRQSVSGRPCANQELGRFAH